MKKFSKILSLILSVVFILTMVSACGNGSGESGDGPSAAKKGFGYVASTKEIKLPEGFGGISTTCFDGERVYFLAFKEKQIPSGKMYEGTNEEMMYYESRTSILSMLPDGSDIKELKGYEPIWPEGSREEMVHTNSINGLQITPDGNLAFIERSSAMLYGDTYSDSEYLNASSLRIISKEGQTLATWSEEEYAKTNESEGFQYIESFTVCPDGRLAVQLSGDELSLVLFSPELKIEGRIDMEDDLWIHSMGRSRKDDVYVFHMDNDGTRKLSYIDFENRNLKPIENVSLNFYGLIGNADEEYDVYTEKGSQSIYGINLETGEEVFLFNWLEMGIMANSGNFLSLGDGKYLAFTWDYGRVRTYEKGMTGDEKVELVLVERKPLSEIPEKVELTLACIYLGGEDMEAVAEFNKTNPKARIKILEYSVYNTENDYNMGLTKLATELTAGNVPDMIVENYDLPLRNFAKKGLFLDLMPMIEADKDLGANSLFEPILKLFKDGDKLYTLYSGFEIAATLAPAGLFGEKSPSFDELEAALKKIRPGATYLGQGYTAYSYMSMAMAGMDKFVDWANGKANFDGEDFINTLKFAKNFPAENDMYKFEKTEYADPRESFIKGDQLLYQTYISSNIDELRALYKLTGGKIVFTGYPGVGSNIVMKGSGISISESCKHPELAWEYARQRILDDGYGALGEDNRIVDMGRWYLPLNKACLDRYFESQMKVVKLESGEEIPHGNVSIGYDTPIEVELFAMDEAERDFIMSVFDNCILNSYYDEGLNAIINEELDLYFKGTKSLEETVKMIQNRASIYVSEKS